MTRITYYDGENSGWGGCEVVEDGGVDLANLNCLEYCITHRINPSFIWNVMEVVSAQLVTL